MGAPPKRREQEDTPLRLDKEATIADGSESKVKRARTLLGGVWDILGFHQAMASAADTKQQCLIGAYPGTQSRPPSLTSDIAQALPRQPRKPHIRISRPNNSPSPSLISLSPTEPASTSHLDWQYSLAPYTKPLTNPLSKGTAASLSPWLFNKSSKDSDILSEASSLNRRRIASPSPFGSHGFKPRSFLNNIRSSTYIGKSPRSNQLFKTNHQRDASILRQRQAGSISTPLLLAKTSAAELRAALDSSLSNAVRVERSSPQNAADKSQLKPSEPESTSRMIGSWIAADDVSKAHRPAFTRTKRQGQDLGWLQNFRNLVARNLPSVEQSPRSKNHQSVVDKHSKIEQDIESRQKDELALFEPLSPEEEQRVRVALSNGQGQVVEGFNYVIQKKDIHTLRPGEWLNDEVINFYGALIMDRAKNTPSLPRVHVFTTFFYNNLSEQGYDKIRRWTKKVDIFSMDYVLMPIHCSGNHWTTAVIDMKQKRIEYYDSLMGRNPKCFVLLRSYLEKESLDKKKAPFDFSGWENDSPKDIPRQRNGYDCGVFTCTFIEFKSRGAADFNFTQDDMELLRKRMVLDIVTKELR